MTTLCHWHHSLAFWLATGQSWIRSGWKKEVGGICTPPYPKIEHALHSQLFADSLLRSFQSYKRLRLERKVCWKRIIASHRSLKVSWEKEELEGTQTLHLATHHCQFSFLILKKGKVLPLLPPFCLLQFNPEKLKISGFFVLFPLWSVCVFPFLTLHLLNTSSPLEAWQCGKRNNESNTETEQEISWKLFIQSSVIYWRKKGQNRVKIWSSNTDLKFWNTEISGLSENQREERQKKIITKTLTETVFSLNL